MVKMGKVNIVIFEDGDKEKQMILKKHIDRYALGIWKILFHGEVEETPDLQLALIEDYNKDLTIKKILENE